jgi:TPP-dependent 2-oxoacid decarboxylase
MSKLGHQIKAKHAAATNKDLLADQKNPSSSIISHEWLWPTMGNFFRPKDVIVTETGICL